MTSPQRETIARTLAAMTARQAANRARDNAEKATDPAERAHHEGRAAELDQQARELVAQARDTAADMGATEYAATMSGLLDRLTPPDPTAPAADALAAAAEIVNDAGDEIAAALAPIYRYAAETIAAQVFTHSENDPDDQHGHEIYAAEIGSPQDGPEIDGQHTAAVAVKVSHLRTHAGDLIELLQDPHAALQLAQIHPTQIVAVVAEGLAYKDEQRTDEPTHARTALVVCPFGLATYARLWDPTTRTWGEPATTWHATQDDAPPGKLPAALIAFYAVQMIAAQVLTETPEPDDN